MTKRERKILQLQRLKKTDKQIDYIMVQWDQAEKRIHGRKK
jgi:hypothetical protein